MPGRTSLYGLLTRTAVDDTTVVDRPTAVVAYCRVVIPCHKVDNHIVDLFFLPAFCLLFVCFFLVFHRFFFLLSKQTFNICFEKLKRALKKTKSNTGTVRRYQKVVTHRFWAKKYQTVSDN